MSTSSYPINQSKGYPVSLILTKRVLLILLVFCIQMIYIPTSNRIAGGIEPKLPIDPFPIFSIWVLPYVLCYILWLAGFLWIILKMEDRLFRAFLAACLLTFSLGAGTFIFFPTYVTAAVLEGNDVFTSLLRFIHEEWGRYAAFPSGHVYITSLLTLFFNRWHPRFIVLWISMLVIVSLSTLFTGQHYFLDVLGGYGVALAGYLFGLWWTEFLPLQKQANKNPHKEIISF